MQDFSNNHPFLFAIGFVVYFICLWCGICLLLGFVSGWRTLAKRFRSTSAFMGSTWSGRSAYMRWLVHLGRILTVGTDSTGLFLRLMILFRIGQPSLLVPWSEVSVRKRGKILFFRYVVLELGRDERIPLIISGDLTDKIQAGAGTEWPVEAIN